VLSVIGKAMTGREEIVCARSREVYVSSWAEICLADPNYDNSHQLISGQLYNAVFISGQSCRQIPGLVNSNLIRFGHSFGYERPKAGLVMRLSELLRETKIMDYGGLQAVVLHESLIGSANRRWMLGISDVLTPRSVVPYYGSETDEQGLSSTFVFLDPEHK
jgi:hypothetical protein